MIKSGEISIWFYDIASEFNYVTNVERVDLNTFLITVDDDKEKTYVVTVAEA